MSARSEYSVWSVCSEASERTEVMLCDWSHSHALTAKVLSLQKQKLGEVVNPSLLALLYAVYSALFGTLSVVFAKILAVLVSVWLNNKVGRSSARPSVSQ